MTLVRKYKDRNGNWIREVNGVQKTLTVGPPAEKVGTALANLIEGLLSIKSAGTCNCKKLASEMDRWGIDGCEKNRAFIVNSLVSNRDMLTKALSDNGRWLSSILASVAPYAVLKTGANILLDKAIEEVRRVLPRTPRVKRRTRRQRAVVKQSILRGIPPEIVSPKDLSPRHLLMHIWPTRNGAWQWNVDQVIARAEVFNGSRTVGVAVDNDTCTMQEVQAYFAERGFDAELFSVPNDKHKREGTTFLRLMAAVSGKPGITFYCHAKGARHGSFGNDTTIRRWTDVMYQATLDRVERVEEILLTNCMAGPFKRYGMFKTPNNKQWHYSGTFYWFRNRDVFSRDWNAIDKTFFAAESWPGRIFWRDEVACLFLDNVGDLYQHEYWRNVVQTELIREGYRCDWK